MEKPVRYILHWASAKSLALISAGPDLSLSTRSFLPTHSHDIRLALNVLEVCAGACILFQKGYLQALCTELKSQYTVIRFRPSDEISLVIHWHVLQIQSRDLQARFLQILQQLQSNSYVIVDNLLLWQVSFYWSGMAWQRQACSSVIATGGNGNLALWAIPCQGYQSFFERMVRPSAISKLLNTNNVNFWSWVRCNTLKSSINNPTRLLQNWHEVLLRPKLTERWQLCTYIAIQTLSVFDVHLCWFATRYTPVLQVRLRTAKKAGCDIWSRLLWWSPPLRCPLAQYPASGHGKGFRKKRGCSWGQC